MKNHETQEGGKKQEVMESMFKVTEALCGK